MEMVEFCEEDLKGVQREATGVPWKDDLWSKKDGLGLKDSEVRVVAMAAIDCGKCFGYVCVINGGDMVGSDECQLEVFKLVFRMGRDENI